jgi:DNA-binding CsgD family transcriptional regulator
VTGKQRKFFSSPSAVELVATFNLTPAEAEVTLKLAAGLTPSEIAVQRGASVHTIRTHLKRARLKTGTRTQAALVGKVFRS